MLSCAYRAIIYTFRLPDRNVLCGLESLWITHCKTLFVCVGWCPLTTLNLVWACEGGLGVFPSCSGCVLSLQTREAGLTAQRKPTKQYSAKLWRAWLRLWVGRYKLCQCVPAAERAALNVAGFSMYHGVLWLIMGSRFKWEREKERESALILYFYNNKPSQVN